jgi:hypothetical protein
VAGAEGTDPLEIGGTRLHLCQICTVEPYTYRKRISHVSVVAAVEREEDTPLDRTTEEETVLESKDGDEIVLAVVKLFAISRALICHRWQDIPRVGVWACC